MVIKAESVSKALVSVRVMAQQACSVITRDAG